MSCACQDFKNTHTQKLCAPYWMRHKINDDLTTIWFNIVNTYILCHDFKWHIKTYNGAESFSNIQSSWNFIPFYFEIKSLPPPLRSAFWSITLLTANNESKFDLFDGKYLTFQTILKRCQFVFFKNKKKRSIHKE